MKVGTASICLNALSCCILISLTMGRMSSSPSPLAGEGGDPRSGEGEGFAATSEKGQQPPHLPIAAQWVPSSPARGEEIRYQHQATARDLNRSPSSRIPR